MAIAKIWLWGLHQFSLLFFFLFLSFHDRLMVMRKTHTDRPRVENLAGLVADLRCYTIALFNGIKSN